MILVFLIMVFEIAVAMVIGFVLGRIWQIRCDLEQERAGVFTAPPIAGIPLVAKRPYEAPVKQALGSKFKKHSTGDTPFVGINQGPIETGNAIAANFGAKVSQQQGGDLMWIVGFA